MDTIRGGDDALGRSAIPGSSEQCRAVERIVAGHGALLSCWLFLARYVPANMRKKMDCQGFQPSSR